MPPSFDFSRGPTRLPKCDHHVSEQPETCSDLGIGDVARKIKLRAQAGSSPQSRSVDCEAFFAHYWRPVRLRVHRGVLTLFDSESGLRMDRIFEHHTSHVYADRQTPMGIIVSGHCPEDCCQKCCPCCHHIRLTDPAAQSDPTQRDNWIKLIQKHFTYATTILDPAGKERPLRRIPDSAARPCKCSLPAQWVEQQHLIKQQLGHDEKHLIKETQAFSPWFVLGQNPTSRRRLYTAC